MAMPNKDRESIQPAENLRVVVLAKDWLCHWRSSEVVGEKSKDDQLPYIEVDGDPDLPTDSLVPQEVTIKMPDGRTVQYVSERPAAIKLRYNQPQPESSVVHIGSRPPLHFLEEWKQGQATGALVQIADLPEGCHLLIDGATSKITQVQLPNNVELMLIDKDDDRWHWRAGEPSQWVRENAQPADTKPASCTNENFYIVGGDQCRFTIHVNDGSEQQIVLKVTSWQLPGRANQQVGTVAFAVRKELSAPTPKEEVIAPLTKAELEELLATVKQITNGPLQELANAAFKGGVNVARIHTLLANAVTTTPHQDDLEQSTTYQRFYTSHILPLRSAIDNAGRQFPSEPKRQLYQKAIYESLFESMEKQWQETVNEEANRVINIVLETYNPHQLATLESLESNLLAEWQKRFNVLNQSDLRELFLVVKVRITHLLAAAADRGDERHERSRSAAMADLWKDWVTTHPQEINSIKSYVLTELAQLLPRLQALNAALEQDNQTIIDTAQAQFQSLESVGVLLTILEKDQQIFYPHENEKMRNQFRQVLSLLRSFLAAFNEGNSVAVNQIKDALIRQNYLQVLRDVLQYDEVVPLSPPDAHVIDLLHRMATLPIQMKYQPDIEPTPAQPYNRLDSYIQQAEQQGNFSLPQDILDQVAALEEELFAKLPGTEVKKTEQVHMRPTPPDSWTFPPKRSPWWERFGRQNKNNKQS
jgi:hypothetical protein